MKASRARQPGQPAERDHRDLGVMTLLDLERLLAPLGLDVHLSSRRTGKRITYCCTVRQDGAHVSTAFESTLGRAISLALSGPSGCARRAIG